MTMEDKEYPSEIIKEDLTPKKNYVCEDSTHVDIPSELEVNRSKEPLFRRYVAHEVNESGPVVEQDLIYSGAEKLGLSSVTTARYMKKMVSKEGIFQRKLVGNTHLIMYK